MISFINRSLLSSKFLNKVIDIDLWAHNRRARSDIEQVKIHRVKRLGSKEDKELSKDFITYIKNDIFDNDLSIEEQRQKYAEFKQDPLPKRREYLLKALKIRYENMAKAQKGDLSKLGDYQLGQLLPIIDLETARSNVGYNVKKPQKAPQPQRVWLSALMRCIPAMLFPVNISTTGFKKKDAVLYAKDADGAHDELTEKVQDFTFKRKERIYTPPENTLKEISGGASESCAAAYQYM